MTRRTVRRARAFSLIIPGVCCLAPSAFAETRAGVDLTASTTVASNPDLATNSDTSVAGTVNISPWLRMADELSYVGLRGNLQFDKYSHRSDSEASGWASLDAGKRMSPYVTIGGGLAYRRTNRILEDLLSRGADGASGIGGGDIGGGGGEVELPSAPVPDVSFGGVQTRNESFEGNLSASVLTSTRGSLNLAIGGRAARYNAPNVANLNSYTASAGYGHTLSERTRLTTSVSYVRNDFLGTRVSDGSTISPQIGITQQLGPTLSVTASVGVSRSRSRRPDNTIRGFTIFAGDFELCKDTERSKYCLIASRSAESTALGGASASTRVSFNLARRVGRRDSLSADVYYVNYDSPTQAVTGRVSKFIGASGSYSHYFTERFSAVATPSLVRLNSDSGTRTSYQIRLGLRYRFGAR